MGSPQRLVMPERCMCWLVADGVGLRGWAVPQATAPVPGAGRGRGGPSGRSRRRCGAGSLCVRFPQSSRDEVAGAGWEARTLAAGQEQSARPFGTRGRTERWCSSKRVGLAGRAGRDGETERGVGLVARTALAGSSGGTVVVSKLVRLDHRVGRGNVVPAGRGGGGGEAVWVLSGSG